MKKIKLAMISIAAVIGVMSFAPIHEVLAQPANESIQNGVNAVGGDDKGNDISLGSRVKTIVNILLYVLGAVAVVMIVIGGVRYATSNGDSSAITGAKNTILYSVVGLVVAMLAYAIVNFVIDAFK